MRRRRSRSRPCRRGGSRARSRSRSGYAITPPARTISAARAIRRGAGCAGLISKYWAKAGPRPRRQPVTSRARPASRSAGSGGSRPRSTWLSSGPWKSEPREASEVELAREVGEARVCWSGEWLPVTTSMPSPPAAVNSARQRVAARLGEQVVAPRVRDDRAAAARADPRHRVGEVGPLLRHVARLPAHEVAPEHARHVARHAAVDQEAREVRAPDQLRILGVTVARPRERPRDADAVELGGDPLGAAPAARAQMRQVRAAAPRPRGRCRGRRCGS